MGKTTGGVETLEDRCSFRRSLPNHLGTFILTKSLLENEKEKNGKDSAFRKALNLETEYFLNI